MEEDKNKRKPATLAERLKAVKKTRWIRFGIVSVIFFLFVVWLNNYWVLLIYPLLFDIYLTLYIPWNWWKSSENKVVRTVMSWVDAILYALVLVYLIFTFIGQNYKIPSSSLEKTLLVGDYLWVNKMCYGPRVPMTPIHFPLCQNTFPWINVKSYTDKPQLKYHRLPGIRDIERNDIVVFNYPTGDTVAFKVQNPDYYTLSYVEGRKALAGYVRDSYSRGDYIDIGSYEFGQRCLAAGGEIIKKNPEVFGDVLYRPVDRRENYVKRAIGLPGEYLKIKNDVVYINGRPLQEPENVQYAYSIYTDGTAISDENWEEAEVSLADRCVPVETAGGVVYAQKYGADGQLYEAGVPLTKASAAYFRSLPFVTKVEKMPTLYDPAFRDLVYPVTKDYGWTRADYATNLEKGIWIPKKGETLKLSLFNLPIYERAIKNYEGNDLRVENGKIYINGKQTDSYTFQLDYYWMMGDNRDNSLDSRYWGFVPEDHVVGTPMFVIISIDQDKGFLQGFRWDRIFKDANPDK